MSVLSKLFAPTDMTTGSPARRIIEFAIPMLIGNVAQQLYNTVDSIVVGKYVGDNALAAVGSASPILNLLLVLFIGVSTGSGIMVSQYFGAKERDKLSHTIGCSITLTLAVSRPFKNMEGNYDTDFIKVSLWNKIAKNTCEYTQKGDIVAVKGRLQMKETEVSLENDKKKITVLEVVGERVIFIQSYQKKEQLSEILVEE